MNIQGKEENTHITNNSQHAREFSNTNRLFIFPQKCLAELAV